MRRPVSRRTMPAASNRPKGNAMPHFAPHVHKQQRRDAGLRNVKNLTALTAVGGLALTGVLAVVAEHAFSGVRTVTADPAATDPAATDPGTTELVPTSSSTIA